MRQLIINHIQSSNLKIFLIFIKNQWIKVKKPARIRENPNKRKRCQPFYPKYIFCYKLTLIYNINFFRIIPMKILFPGPNMVQVLS